ncbi:MAG: NAD-dependent epimerase/dehydratase family protein [Campylobacter curvus]
MKKVFLAGASGVLGMRICKILLQNGYDVYGTTRSEAKAQNLAKIGVKPVIVDVFDYENLQAQMKNIAPEILMHQLTDLPDGLDYAGKMDEVLARNARIRVEGTANLIKAAKISGVKKMIAQSIAFIYEPSDGIFTESSPLLNFADATYGETSRGVHSLETQVLDAPFVGVVLRNGLLYGGDTGFSAPFEGMASVHVDAAANAAFLALKCQSNEIFNIVDTNAKTSNQKAKKLLGWDENFRL